MVGLQEDTELSESPSFSFLNVGMSGSLSLIFLAKFQTEKGIFPLIFDGKLSDMYLPYTSGKWYITCPFTLCVRCKGCCCDQIRKRGIV